MGRKLKKLKVMRFNRHVNTTLTFLVIAGITYGFLALCNWSVSLPEWTGFSRFILAAEGVIFLIKLIDEL